MPNDSSEWTRAVSLDRLQSDRALTVRLAGKQVALFLHQEQVFACNNRCPHEGYPLVEGALDADCVLTCHWHNWKFDLKTGVTLTGGDALRSYPVRLEDGAVWVDLQDPPTAERVELSLRHLDQAIDKFDRDRIARELARLDLAGAAPEIALVRAIRGTYDRLPDGMTHAYAAADVWMRLRDSIRDETARLVCATEAMSYIAWDTLREKVYPFAGQRAAWRESDFAAAVEAQDEKSAAPLLNGALADGLHFSDLEGALASSALAHYNDFGHSLIYLTHVASLVERLGAEVERPLLLAWLRSVILATREDLLPDFRAYAEALASWRRGAPRSGAPLSADAFEGQSVRRTLDATLSARGHPPLQVYGALLEASARHLLRFDERHALRTDNSAADDVGWLDFSHAITFAHALRRQCERHPSLWPQGLLQLALFVGRNSKYLDAGLPAERALREWAVADEAALDRRAIALMLDHGCGLPIFPAHWLKTWSAARDEVASGLPDAARRAVLAAVNRLLAVRFKQRHTMRTAHQAIRFVGIEDS
ncbi:MAG TPA: Rieske (2Fe-2S) protein [Burkholderiaceae bacterium]|nr:Rieske (2Fe-2S) protein [Burkholderiaceae bacterium]